MGAADRIRVVELVRDVERRQKLSIVVPVLNEEDAIPMFLDRIQELRHELDKRYGLDSEVVFVDDGSSDGTRQVVRAAIDSRGEAESWIRLIGFTRNFGKEIALTAGLREAGGDLVVPMDVDLQDPPGVVLEMVQVWIDTGACVVQAIRSDRSEDTFLKRYTAEKFYGLMQRISSVKLEPNAGDFQLLSRQAVQALMEYPERTRFMKGLSASIGFRREKVFYKRASRVAGTTKFNGWRLWNFALDGITSFSTVPLRVWTYAGMAIAAAAIAFAAWTLIRTMLLGVVTPGYASMMVAVLFIGGVQLIGLGVIGEYVGRVAVEVRNRPMYHVEVREGFPENGAGR